jgi:hypothetical protein
MLTTVQPLNGRGQGWRFVKLVHRVRLRGVGGKQDVFSSSWGGGSNQRHSQDLVLGWGGGQQLEASSLMGLGIALAVV